jgi:hypothetical protein
MEEMVLLPMDTWPIRFLSAAGQGINKRFRAKTKFPLRTTYIPSKAVSSAVFVSLRFQANASSSILENEVLGHLVFANKAAKCKALQCRK